MNLGEKLYWLRTERGIYQKELAAELHLSISAISSYENGVHSPDIKTVEKFAKFFNVSTDYLLGRTECMMPIEDMNKKLMDQYNLTQIINTMLELSPKSRQDAADHANILKAAQSIAKSNDFNIKDEKRKS